MTNETARTLFHACTRIWKPGEIITTGGAENFYWQRLAREGERSERKPSVLAGLVRSLAPHLSVAAPQVSRICWFRKF